MPTPEVPPRQGRSHGFAGALKVIAGSSNPDLAAAIARNLGISLGDVALGRFPDGEVRFQIKDNVRGADVFVIQSTSPPVNENLMELLLMVDALKRASAARINAVIPYYGYARQDRKDRPRVPVSAKLVADLLTVAGVHRVIAMDLHAGQIQGYFNIPVDHLYATPVMLEMFPSLGLERPIIVSPDAGGVERGAGLREEPGRWHRRDGQAPRQRQSGRDHPCGGGCPGPLRRVGGRHRGLRRHAGTRGRGASERRRHPGPGDVHPCGPFRRAVERIEGGRLERLIVGDTIPLSPEVRNASTKIQVLSVASLFARAIESVHGEASVSSLFV